MCGLVVGVLLLSVGLGKSERLHQGQACDLHGVSPRDGAGCFASRRLRDGRHVQSVGQESKLGRGWLLPGDRTLASVGEPASSVRAVLQRSRCVSHLARWPGLVGLGVSALGSLALLADEDGVVVGDRDELPSLGAVLVEVFFDHHAGDLFQVAGHVLVLGHVMFPFARSAIPVASISARKGS